MPYEVAPLPFKPHRLTGLSERLLVSHYENNYGGAVRRLNAIEADVAEVDWGSAPGYGINGLKREELIAFNSMILHEIYFDGLGGTGDPAGDLAEALERDFGSVERWRREFGTMGKALAGGAGWVLLTLSERDGRLRNAWAADHTHTPADGRIVLALDMYEHAYHLDFGAKAAAYVDAFMGNIHWDRVAARHRRAAEQVRNATTGNTPADVPTMTVRDLRQALERSDVLVLDVRHEDDVQALPELIPGAVHHDARLLDEWVGTLPKDREIVVHCAYGFQVGWDAAAELQHRGFRVHTLAGGIATWRASGAPTVPKLRSVQERGTGSALLPASSASSTSIKESIR